MATAKDIVVKPIKASAANEVVRRIHYSGKTVNNSQLHFGVFLNGRLEGVMQFGPSLDKRKIQGLVEGTGWNGFIELNRMAFSDVLPRNSESRAMAVAFRLIRKHYPHIEWVISFSDGTQCGDGTIYRAAGFVLTQIKKNTQVWRHDDGTVISRTAMTNLGQKGALKQRRDMSVKYGKDFTNLAAASMKEYASVGFSPLEGFQLRYIYFLNQEARCRLTVPVLPFSKISDMGASMYRGERITRVKKQDSENPSGLGGAVPTDTLHNCEELSNAR
jgi:hypothetical protein